jgi:ribose transport system substrate-binding protein
VAPTTISVTQSLPKKPLTGKTVIVLACAVPTCQIWNKSFSDAAQALGWKVKTMTYNPANPDAAVLQSVSEHPDFIVIGGPPRAAIAQGLTSAHQAGIPVLVHSGSVGSDPASGFYAGINDNASQELGAKMMANWIVSDSGGKAHAVVMGSFEFPSQQVAADAYAAVLKSCPGCSLDKVAVSNADLGSGKVPSLVVGYLQAHPDTNYVAFAFGDLVVGVPEALKSAGLAGKVKIVASDSDSPAFTKYQMAGKVAAQVVPSVDWIGWASIDELARISVGAPLVPDYLTPAYIVDTPQAAQSLLPQGIWAGPVDIQTDFKKLWLVG